MIQSVYRKSLQGELRFIYDGLLFNLWDFSFLHELDDLYVTVDCKTMCPNK